MKVILLTTRTGYNDLLYWDNILSSLKKKYPSFKVFTAFPSMLTKNGLVKTEKKIKSFILYFNRGKLNQKFIFIPTPSFILKLIKFKPNVIIINEFSLICFYVVMFKGFYREAKIVQLVESDPNRGLGYDEKNNLKRIYRKFISRRVDIIHTNNSLGENYIAEYLEQDRSKINTAPYLTSQPILPELVQRSESDIIRFIYIGQLIERKGLTYLIDAFKLIEQQDLQDVEVLIIGSGDLKNKLIEMVKANNQQYIKFIGNVEYKEIGKYLQKSDCLILPTLRDYRALVSFEALFFGLAILSSSFNGARFEVVQEDMNGYIFNPLDIKDFSMKIKTIIKNPKKLNEFKKYSLNLSKKFTEESCSQNLFKTIEK